MGPGQILPGIYVGANLVEMYNSVVIQLSHPNMNNNNFSQKRKRRLIMNVLIHSSNKSNQWFVNYF